MLSIGKSPGKLYLAGEYAVVETGFPAVIASVNQYVTVTVTESENGGTIQSKNLNKELIHWDRQGTDLVFDDTESQLAYILTAIKFVEKYALEKHKKLAYYDLLVTSELDSHDGKKFGLGSSAAVTVAVVKALGSFYGLNLSKMDVYKLASIAHLSVQGNGSLGDIAASAFGGIIAYRSPDRNWVFNMVRNHSLSKLLKLDWPNLRIEPLHLPKELEMVVGWTGSPASTSILVDRIALTKAQKVDKYQHFLKSSRQSVEQLIQGFRDNDAKMIKQMISSYRQVLTDLARFSDVHIETKMLTKLCDIAESLGGAAKTSGAGGGDCGIVISNKNLNIENLKSEWKKVGITPLQLKIGDIIDHA
ncbi:phosphomevalonate kinase [Companilactobacillus sp.]|uniref:phosphomevalonate kinase n=1 Tax=Companilactobacillus sp. TaxID=2767905 RepID=UPI0025C0BD88|nr:phosphomevalonate kinase [Companilactobacillus sp.]MCH4008238.1 phosphomevalonate kinase [Companilactobacillus sp.]MCH4051583.1 phosphomevalonate kinase [Companilactobacillus sp.]MCH4076181.1 phosphomevalonate kinase [Companilactobacillus sp.]MCH4124756.1 phosphomevalonate kinase [Companilactobacillus sp.]MCH4131298.1 phosphomevalonate kinase [Companilactobacillus sp.]